MIFKTPCFLHYNTIMFGNNAESISNKGFVYAHQNAWLFSIAITDGSHGYCLYNINLSKRAGGKV